jgi:hypothetical protein
MYRGLCTFGAQHGFRLVIPEHFGILRKGYERILRTQVNQKGRMSYAESVIRKCAVPDAARGMRAVTK